MNNFKVELNAMKKELGIVSRIKCTPKEQKEFRTMEKAGEPITGENNDQVFYDSVKGFYYRKVPTDITNEEISQLLAYRQMNHLRNISTGVTFFVLLVVIGLILSIFSCF